MRNNFSGSEFGTENKNLLNQSIYTNFRSEVGLCLDSHVSLLKLTWGTLLLPESELGFALYRLIVLIIRVALIIVSLRKDYNKARKRFEEPLQ